VHSLVFETEFGLGGAGNKGPQSAFWTKSWGAVGRVAWPSTSHLGFLNWEEKGECTNGVAHSLQGIPPDKANNCNKGGDHRGMGVVVFR